ncbi:DNA polymerase III subunit beta (plasmid) [Rubrobacter tropicus]|uniref:Beta sliding clamp n=1 Tax=Rubrobacter tropicus TaxID=2653851 RepID=A0A6G8QGD5_9ACTN|nr:DNA polymerase III subunit beta [Rubrobacter tropicus]QIN85471.1 DNA polymerase III subunit beta [Rubrobacter tropicus]
MKIRSTSGMLSGLLEMVARAVSARSHIQLLSAVLFEADEDANLLTMKATDMEISISLTAETPVEEGGKVAIPAKMLLQYAKSLPEGEAELETDESGANATLSCGGSSVSLNCYAPDDFPTLPEFPEPSDGEADGSADADGTATAAAFSVDAAALSEAVSKVLPFASKDESRAVLMGVLVAFSEGSATLAATDSYRLGLNSQKLDGAVEGAPTAILPARALKEAVRLTSLAGEDGRIEVAITENQAMFRAGEAGLTLATRLIDGNYPEYGRLLPDGFEETFSVKRDDLLTAIGRARIVAGKQTPPPPLKLAFSHEEGTLGGGEVAISLAADTGAATEVLSADVPEGKAFEICFNPHYLAEAVSSISDETVALRLNESLKPAVLRPAAELAAEATNGSAGTDPEGPPDGYLHLIMPMRDPSRNGS